MTPRIGVFSFGRTQSERCPNKMLRPFAGTSLTDLMMTKLSQLGADVFFAGHEDVFADKAREHGVPFVRRSLASATIDEPITEILSFLRDVPYSHLLIVNACLPFLRVGTIRAFLDDAAAHQHQPAFAVVKRQNHFLSLDRRPLNFPSEMRTINSKTVTPVHEFAHALYFFDRDYFFSHGRYWDWQEVRLVELGDRYELIDIDTEEDFAFAEALWRGRQLQGIRP
jgi:CMP-N-acetylneuraminic acid synthetase